MASFSSDDFARAYERLRADRSIQFDFPPRPPPEPPYRPPAWLKAFGEFIQSLGGLWEALFWIAVIAGGILLVVLIGRHLIERRRLPQSESAKASKIEESWRPEAAPARRLLEEADALAAAGKYAEAAHTLLIRSIEDIEARRPRFLSPALTSRDIAASETLPADARSAFSTIARVVELSLFGRRSVEAEAWQNARAAYSLFAFGRSWA